MLGAIGKKRSLTIRITVAVSLGLTPACQRSQLDAPAKVVVDLNKVAGVNVCPDRIPDLPHANTDLSILLPPETPPGTYDVVVYRADPLRSVGQTGTVTAANGEAALRVKLNLRQLEPGVYTLGISTRPKVSYCDVRVR
jgi:hypothetical protein